MEEIIPNLFLYRAKVVNVYDGDTITVDIDLGFDVIMSNRRIRMYRLNAPEMRGEERPEGIKSRDFLRELILKKDVYLHTIEDRKGKYGRYLGIIYLINNDGSLGDNVNAMMLEGGYAKEYNLK